MLALRLRPESLIKRKDRVMAYSYRADVNMAVDLQVEASSYDEALELIEQFLAPVSDDGRVSVHSNHGIEVNSIEREDDPTRDIDTQLCEAAEGE